MRRAGRRAWGFEERLEEGRGSVLAWMCLREMKDRIVKEKGWVRERYNFFKGDGIERLGKAESGRESGL